MHLIVTEPFGPYRKGDRITSDVEAVLREHAASVVKVAALGPVGAAQPALPAAPEAHEPAPQPALAEEHKDAPQ
jgi:hypothetical protein